MARHSDGARSVRNASAVRGLCLPGGGWMGSTDAETQSALPPSSRTSSPACRRHRETSRPGAVAASLRCTAPSSRFSSSPACVVRFSRGRQDRNGFGCAHVIPSQRRVDGCLVYVAGQPAAS